MIHVDEQIQWTITDPYVYAKASELVGAMAEVQTTHGAVRGTLKEVQPDHIVVEMGGTPFYIRTQQIVWFFPVS
ncbi:YuzF family protein [Bacillus gibsonii]|nr:YuzF family protein [Alkalicoccobacillus gibsonii]